MTIKFTGCTAKGNGGDGFHLVGDVDAEFIDTNSVDNKGHGFNLQSISFMKELGLPEDTNPAELLELLKKLNVADSAERIGLARKSSIAQKCANLGMTINLAATSLIAYANDEVITQKLQAILNSL